MQVDFYHLTQLPLERALPRIAERVVAGGGRLLVVAEREEARQALDRCLWAYTPESFLPHAQAGGESDARQPILIAGAIAPANGARNIALADGIWRDGALDFERTFHFFNEDRIVEARQAWRTLGERGEVVRRYWKQNDSGRWEQAA